MVRSRKAVAAVARLNLCNLAALLLLVGTCRHYGWYAFPIDLAAVASKGIGGLAMLVLIWTVYALSEGGRLLLAVAAWWSFEEAQVALCSVAWMVEPWYVPQGQPMCSARAGFDIGAISVVLVAALAVAVSSYSRHNSKGSQNA